MFVDDVMVLSRFFSDNISIGNKYRKSEGNKKNLKCKAETEWKIIKKCYNLQYNKIENK